MHLTLPIASHAQLLIPAELAHDTVDALGEVGQLQFKDLNTSKSAFQRTYANQVRDNDAAVELRIHVAACSYAARHSTASMVCHIGILGSWHSNRSSASL